MTRRKTTAYLAATLALFLLTFGSGCASLVKNKKKVEIPVGYQQAKTATLDELIALINQRYAAINSLVASRFEVEFNGGSAELGFVEQYPKAKGYLAAKLPASIYVNILNPLTSSTVAAMASRNDDFQIWAPHDNKYLVGKTTVRLEEDRPLFNVRPHHLLKALIIDPIPADTSDSAVFLAEEQDTLYKYYVVHLLQRNDPTARFCLARKIWIERSSMRMMRQQYYDCGVAVSDIHYARPIERSGFLVNSEVDVDRIREHYRIHLKLDQDGLEVNRAIKDDRFEIPKPAGAELIVVEEKSFGEKGGR